MKKRLAKKIEKMRRKKVHEALEIVLEINTTQARAQSKTGCKPTAFFEFDGHVGGMGFAVHPDGWKKWGSSPDEFKEYLACFKIDGSVDRMKKKLANVKKVLQDAGKM